MKFNWGHGILGFIILFFVLTTIFVVWSFKQDFSLVEENYYAKELKYQEVITKRNNAASLPEQIRFEQSERGILIHFPQLVRNKKIDGNIAVYRPSDVRLDLNFPIALDTALCQLLPASKLVKGKYIIKLGWSLDDMAYYQEETVIIP